MRNVYRNTLLCLLVTVIFVMPIQALYGNTPKFAENTGKDYLSANAKSDSWVKHFEGTSWGDTVIQANDGGYVVGGGTGYDTGSDALLIKTDSEGNQEWKTTFGNSLGWDAFEGLVETSDGGFVASGTKGTNGFLAKVDADGNTLWQKTYGGSTDGYCIDVRQTIDGGFIMAGLYYSEPRSGWMIRTDSEGNELWSKTYGGDYPITFHSVRLTADGGFIFSGWDETDDISPISLAVKTDAQGNILWENFYDSCNVFHSGMQTSDGRYIFTGSHATVIPLNLGQICMVKTDSEGNRLWSKTFGTPLFGETSLWVEETNDGGYVVIGTYLGLGKIINLIQNNNFFPLRSNVWIIKTDSDGNLEWGNKDEKGFGRCVKQTTDGGFIATGQRGAYNIPEGVLLIKTDSNGNIG